MGPWGLPVWGLSPLGSVPRGGEHSPARSGTQWELWQLHPTPRQSCHHSPPSLPASQTFPHGATHGADVPGLSPATGRFGMLPLGVHCRPTVEQHGLQGFGLPSDAAGLGMAQSRRDPQGRSGHASFSRPSSLLLALGSLFKLTWFPQLDFPGSFPWAGSPVLTSVSSPAPPGRRSLGPGLLAEDLRARFCGHTVPGVAPRLRAPPAAPGCFPGLSPSARCQQRASLTSTAPAGNYKTHYLFGKTLCKAQEKGWNPFSSRRPETARPPRLLFSMPALSRVKAVGAFVIKMAIVEPGNKFNIIKGAGRVSLICCSSKKSVSCFRKKK